MIKNNIKSKYLNKSFSNKLSKKYEKIFSEINNNVKNPRETLNILDGKLKEKPKDLIPFGQSNQATRIRRLRYLNDLVIALEEIWIDKSVGDFRSKNISESLYKYYAEHLGLWISKAEDSVSIEKVPKWAPEAFSLDKGTLTGFVERLSWGQFKYPVEYSRTWFDTSRSRYVQRLQ